MTPDVDEAPATPEPEQRRRKHGFWKELPFLILIALVLALVIKTFLVQAFYIPTASMENTLQGGPPDRHFDRVLVNKLIYRIRDPHRGEIVVFRGPPSWQDTPEFTGSTPSNSIARVFHDIGAALGVSAPSSKDFIKRVVGVGGDTVSCQGGVLRVNGHQLDEPYLYPGSDPCTGDDFNGQTVHVPKGRLFVLGDHRDASADSRAHLSDGEQGTIPISDVIGKAFMVVWPPSDWKTLPVPNTFRLPGLAAAAASPLALGFAGAIPVTLVRRSRRRRRRRQVESFPDQPDGEDHLLDRDGDVQCHLHAGKQPDDLEQAEQLGEEAEPGSNEPPAGQPARDQPAAADEAAAVPVVLNGR